MANWSSTHICIGRAVVVPSHLLWERVDGFVQCIVLEFHLTLPIPVSILLIPAKTFFVGCSESLILYIVALGPEVVNNRCLSTGRKST